jgi:hypothetical protein
MPLLLDPVWDDENFTIQVGDIPARAELSGAEVGPGIIYYPIRFGLTHRVGGDIQSVTSPGPCSTELSFLWNTGPETQIFNPHASSSRFVRVALKPSSRLAAELPADFFGLASAALLQDNWDDQFKDSVREDLDAIADFIEPLRSGRDPDPQSRERAILAKQDLDLKLFWSAREYRRRGIFSLGYHVTALAAATPAGGSIKVTVHTKDAANTPVSPCIVWYVTRINHNRPGSYKSFSQFSTPTSEYLGVANYDMWAERGGVTGSRRVISVVSASATQSVDLLAP